MDELNLQRRYHEAEALSMSYWNRLTLGTNTHLVLSVVLEESLDTTAGELNVRD